MGSCLAALLPIWARYRLCLPLRVSVQVRGETPMGGRDEGWAARAFVLHDWVPVSEDAPGLQQYLGQLGVGAWLL